jgi:hypothetical protein
MQSALMHRGRFASAPARDRRHSGDRAALVGDVWKAFLRVETITLTDDSRPHAPKRDNLVRRARVGNSFVCRDRDA